MPTKKVLGAMKRKRQAAFLEALKQAGTILGASKIAGIHRDTVFDWRMHDEKFAAAFDNVRLDLLETLEASAIEKALKPDGALMNMFMLKAMKPEIYRENTQHVQLTGPNGGPIETKQLVPIKHWTDDNLMKLIAATTHLLAAPKDV